MVERESSYASNIMSNLVLNGSRTVPELTFGYDDLTGNYGVDRMQGVVSSIDPDNRTVQIVDGPIVEYDRLVLAPGIEFDLIPGLDTSDYDSGFPHAWQAGPQTTNLWNQIQAMPDGGVFVMSIPLAPYRCPPGPYERACVVADWLRRNKRGCKVVVLDANQDITAERETFTYAFTVTYADIIEYLPGTLISEIDKSSRLVRTNWSEDIRGDVINPIPSQRAGSILKSNGLINVNDRWAGVNVLSYESTAVGRGIHIIGDAAGTTQPKAGHIANTEAKVCADAIIRLFNGDQPDPSPVTNSACYSPVTSDTASWLTAVFGYDPVSETMKVVPGSSGEARSPTRENFQEMQKWFQQLMADSFA
jgi:NADPH-dependent 2,4-dienoyl-CoA reductase/sulfur reductase-like enzyme